MRYDVKHRWRSYTRTSYNNVNKSRISHFVTQEVLQLQLHMIHIKSDVHIIQLRPGGSK